MRLLARSRLTARCATSARLPWRGYNMRVGRRGAGSLYLGFMRTRNLYYYYLLSATADYPSIYLIPSYHHLRLIFPIPYSCHSCPAFFLLRLPLHILGSSLPIYRLPVPLLLYLPSSVLRTITQPPRLRISSLHPPSTSALRFCLAFSLCHCLFYAHYHRFAYAVPQQRLCAAPCSCCCCRTRAVARQRRRRRARTARPRVRRCRHTVPRARIKRRCAGAFCVCVVRRQRVALTRRARRRHRLSNVRVFALPHQACAACARATPPARSRGTAPLARIATPPRAPLYQARA